MNFDLPRPTKISAPTGSTWFEISWHDGARQRIPNAILRGYCPCAGCQGHAGPVAFIPGNDSELLDIEQVGNYGLKLQWGDRHETGIYTFRFLKTLGDLYAEHGDELPTRMPKLTGP